jgi:hypothetical protein
VSLNPDLLVVKKNGKELIFESNSNLIKIDGVVKKLPSIIIWIDGVYYLPEAINSYISNSSSS